MKIDINAIASVSDIQKNWHSITDKIDIYKEVLVLKNNKPSFVLMDIVEFMQLSSKGFINTKFKTLSSSEFKLNIAETIEAAEHAGVLILQMYHTNKYVILSVETYKRLYNDITQVA